jgi:hypothetical protein
MAGALTISLYIVAATLLTILVVLRVCRPKAKSTAQGVAACRYLATFEEDPYVRCNDHLAKHFAPVCITPPHASTTTPLMLSVNIIANC